MATGFLIFPVGYTPIIGGVTVPGGKIHFTRTGTSTAQDTYSNSTLGSANANPVVLNASGALATKVYGDPTTGFNYRIRIVDANDVEVMAAVDDVTGDVDDTRLSANVPLLNASNVFTGAIQYIESSDAKLILSDSDHGVSNERYWQLRSVSGVFALSALSDNQSSSEDLILADRSGVGITSCAIAADLITLNGIAFGTGINTQNGNYTLVAADAGITIYKSSGAAGETITIPANASVAFAVGTRVRVANHGGGTLSLAITTDTLVHTAGTGTRTLADGALVEIEKVEATVWMLNGSGIT